MRSSLWPLSWEIEPLSSPSSHPTLSRDMRSNQPTLLYLLVFKKCSNISDPESLSSVLLISGWLGENADILCICIARTHPWIISALSSTGNRVISIFTPNQIRGCIPEIQELIQKFQHSLPLGSLSVSKI